MKFKQIVSAVIILSYTFTAAYAYTPTERLDRKLEYLNRDTAAVKVGGGVYLSWRLLGTENISDQAFDIYRNDMLIYTTGSTEATCYTDSNGKISDTYKVVKHGEPTDQEKPVTVWNSNITGSSDGVINSAAYLEIPVDRPQDDIVDIDGTAYSYTAGDASVADLDGDGEYEIILKWDPSNQQDNGSHAYTGLVYVDAYKMDGTRLWRINMGQNIRAGAHYTQIIAYDFDNDGRAEIAMKTAPGTVDGKGKYVSEAGVNDAIKTTNNTADYRTHQSSNSPQRRIGHIVDGPEYLTIFNGKTGQAMQTIDYVPSRGKPEDWGDGYGNRCNRYLAGVAYLDGENPSMLFCRGYYARSAIAAYDWDGKNLIERWITDSSDSKNESLYGQGNHSLIVSDIDNDGKDEIVYGSAAVDDDGSVMYSTGHGHGDVLHVSDFDNDGQQEVFQSHEDYKTNSGDFGTEYRRAGSGEILFSQNIYEDVAKGIMANCDDSYALSHPESPSVFWTSSLAEFYNSNGELIVKDNSPTNRRFFKYCLYWDGTPDRALLDGSMLAKLRVNNDGKFTRFFFGRSGSFPDAATTGSFPLLTADIFGDWREEVIMRTADGSAIRIYMSCIPTEYRIPTLMHDSQYRTCVAAENVAYNQVPHTSYYIGSLAMAKDSEGRRLSYLQPQTPYTKVQTVSKSDELIRIDSISNADNKINVEIINKDESINAVAVMANYNADNEMIDVLSENVTLDKYKNMVSFEYTENNDSKTVKVFLWDNIDDMRPLCETAEIYTD